MKAAEFIRRGLSKKEKKTEQEKHEHDLKVVDQFPAPSFCFVMRGAQKEHVSFW